MDNITGSFRKRNVFLCLWDMTGEISVWTLKFSVDFKICLHIAGNPSHMSLKEDPDLTFFWGSGSGHSNPLCDGVITTCFIGRIAYIGASLVITVLHHTTIECMTLRSKIPKEEFCFLRKSITGMVFLSTNKKPQEICLPQTPGIMTRHPCKPSQRRRDHNSRFRRHVNKYLEAAHI